MLVVSVGLALLVAVAGALTGDADDRTLGNVLQIVLLPLGLLLPVIGVLSATGEWSQRTALTTFALVPRRGRVVAAKVLATVALGLAACVVWALVGTAGAVVAGALGGAPDPWSVDGALLAQGPVALVLSIVWGVAFGLLVMAPAPAIVAYFAVPTVFALLGELVTGLDRAWDWLDPNRGIDALTRGDLAGSGWAHLVVSGALWIGVPLALGTLRTLRREVK
ncbi:ABC transporter permease [Patulibacter sp. S7RM1-6]